MCTMVYLSFKIRLKQDILVLNLRGLQRALNMKHNEITLMKSLNVLPIYSRCFCDSNKFRNH